MNKPRFTATDLEGAFEQFCDDGRFELARLTLIEANKLRANGDKTVSPTEPDANEYLQLAGELEKIGTEYQFLAQVARAIVALK